MRPRYLPVRDRGGAVDHTSIAELIAVANGTDDEAAMAAIHLLDDISDDRADVTHHMLDLIEAKWIRAMLPRGIDPWAAPPEVLAGWLDALREHHGWPSIAVHVRTVRDGHIRRGLPDPMAHPLVIRTLASLRTNCRNNPRGHEPLLVEDYVRLRAAIPATRTRDVRDRLIMGFAYRGPMEIGEIANLMVRDVDLRPGGIVLRTRRRGSVRKIEIEHIKSDDIAADLVDYLARTGIEDGPLLRSMPYEVPLPETMTLKTLTKIFKERVRQAGLDPRRYGFGSLRLGFMASAKLRGVDEIEIAKRAGYQGIKAFRYRLETIGAHGKPLLDHVNT